MKWAVLVCLATPIGILVASGIAAIVPSVADSLNNVGAHGFLRYYMLILLLVVTMVLLSLALMPIHHF